MKRLLILGLFVWGCGGEPMSDGASGGGGGAPDDDDAPSGGLGGVGTSGPQKNSCLSESNCEALHTAGVQDCAVVDCDYRENDQCTLKAGDKDGDGSPDECFSSDPAIVVHQLSGLKTPREKDWDCNPYRSDIHPSAWDGPAVGSHADACDGLDNNCNGKTDEDADPESGVSCSCVPKLTRRCALVEATQRPSEFLVETGALEGACRLGSTLCDSTGRWGPCVGAVEPKEEACDSLLSDLNCDGIPGIDQLDTIESSSKVEFLCDNDGDGQVPSKPTSAHACVEAKEELERLDCGKWVLASTVDKRAVDCDDHNAQIGFGFAETCDGVDSNCRGDSDDEDPYVILPGGGNHVESYACTRSGPGAPPSPIPICEVGYESCDSHSPGGIVNGCEVDIRTIANCGACGETCDFACSGKGPSPFACAEVESFSSGGSHTCARISDGRVSCWGGGDSGQIGDGQSLTQAAPVAALDIAGLSVPRATFIATGGEHSCAIVESGDVYCWGSGSAAQNGSPNVGSRNRSKPEKLPDTVKGAVSLALGAAHSCAVLGDGGIRCWGDQYFGRLGWGPLALFPPTHPKAGEIRDDGIPSPQVAAVDMNSEIDPDETGVGGEASVAPQPRPFTSADQVAPGWYHTCALENGKVYCAGDNYMLALGLGTDTDVSESLYFVRVPNLEGVSQMGSGLDFSCALKEGQVYCWGSNDLGQLGIAPSDPIGEPTLIQNLSNVTELAVGGAFVCVLSDGEVSCWGANGQGQLGRETGEEYSPDPVPVAALSGATMIRAGSNQACALLDGKLNCWGSNVTGQLGRGGRDEEPHYAPMLVKPLGPNGP